MKESDNEAQRYISYLLRLWQIERHGLKTWHASLISSQSGDRVSFACLNDLFTYLRLQVEKGKQEDDE